MPQNIVALLRPESVAKHSILTMRETQNKTTTVYFMLEAGAKTALDDCLAGYKHKI